MTKLSESIDRFDKPGTTSDFTSTQFELIQLSHEWEKLRDQAERVRDVADVEPLSTTVEETSTPTLTPMTNQVGDPSPANEKPISDTE